MIDWAFWLNYLEVCAVIVGFFLVLVYLDPVMGPGVRQCPD